MMDSDGRVISSLHGPDAVDPEVKSRELTLLYTHTSNSDFLSMTSAIQDLVWKFEASEQLEMEWHELPTDVQIDLVPKVRYFSESCTLSYMKLLRVNGFPSLPLIKRWNDRSLESFCKIFKDSTGVDWISEPASAEFSRQFLSAVSETPSWDKVNVIHLMRATFGQQVMLECLDRLPTEIPGASFFGMIPIMQDWENLKQYPLGWSSNLVEGCDIELGLNEGPREFVG